MNLDKNQPIVAFGWSLSSVTPSAFGGPSQGSGTGSTTLRLQPRGNSPASPSVPGSREGETITLPW